MNKMCNKKYKKHRQQIIFLICLYLISILVIPLSACSNHEHTPYDLSISSILGFVQEDTDAMKAITEIEEIAGVYEEITDKFVLQSISDSLLKPELTEGRYPKTGNELAADVRYADQNNLKIGDKITYNRADGSLQSGTIVGFAKPVFDIVKETAIPFLYMSLNQFHTDCYNKIYIRVTDPNDETLIAQTEKQLEKICERSTQKRYETLYGQAQRKVNEQKSLMNAMFDPLESHLEQKRTFLAQSASELNEKETERLLSDTQNDLIKAEDRLSVLRMSLDSSKEQLNQSRIVLDATKAELEQQRLSLEALKTQLEQHRNQLGERLSQIGVSVDELDNYIAVMQHRLEEDPENAEVKALLQIAEQAKLLSEQIKTEEATLQTGSAQYEDALVRYTRGEAEYKAALASVESGEYDYNNALSTLQTQMTLYESKYQAFNSAKTLFHTSEEKLKTSEAAFAEKKSEYSNKLSELEKKRNALKLTTCTIKRFGSDGSTLPKDTLQAKVGKDNGIK